LQAEWKYSKESIYFTKVEARNCKIEEFICDRFALET